MQLEDWLVDIEIVADLTDESRTKSAQAKSKVLTHTLITEALASGKCWEEIKDLLVEAWYSLEQYIGLKEDKLSSTTVDFIRSEGNLETKHLYCFRKPKMC